MRPVTKQVCLHAFALACLVVLSAGCSKKGAGPPAPEFEEATKQFGALYGKHLDNAYVQPEADRILALLDKVPADSVSKPDADALKARITQGRARLESEEAEREAAAEEAGKGTDEVPPGPSDAPPPPPSDDVPPPVAEAPDAGSGVPTVGMAFAEFQKSFGGCFARGEQILLQGHGMKDAWTLRTDLGKCQADLPGFADKIILTDTKILLIANKSAVKPADEADAGARAPSPAGDGGAAVGR